MQNYSYQDPVQEVATEDEMTSDENDERRPHQHVREGGEDDDFDEEGGHSMELHEEHPVYQHDQANLGQPYHGVDGHLEEIKRDASPISDRLAESEFVRASDPGRFGQIVEDINDIQVIARRESKANQNSKSNSKRKHKESDAALECSEDMKKQGHMQDHLDSDEEGQASQNSEQ